MVFSFPPRQSEVARRHESFLFPTSGQEKVTIKVKIEKIYLFYHEDEISVQRILKTSCYRAIRTWISRIGVDKDVLKYFIHTAKFAYTRHPNHENLSSSISYFLPLIRLLLLALQSVMDIGLLHNPPPDIPFKCFLPP